MMSGMVVLVPGECDGDVAIAHAGIVIALEKDRAGLSFVAVERPAGDAGYLDVVVDGLAVADHGEVAAYQREVESLPLAGAQRQVHRRRDKAVERAHFVGWAGAAFAAYLDFVAAAQVDAA